MPFLMRQKRNRRFKAKIIPKKSSSVFDEDFLLSDFLFSRFLKEGVSTLDHPPQVVTWNRSALFELFHHPQHRPADSARAMCHD